jgi:hypothetical protein
MRVRPIVLPGDAKYRAISAELGLEPEADLMIDTRMAATYALDPETVRRWAELLHQELQKSSFLARFVGPHLPIELLP